MADERVVAQPQPMPISEFRRHFREAFHRDLTMEETIWFRLANLVIDDPEPMARDTEHKPAA